MNEHNSWIPRDSWLEDWEKKAIADYYVLHCEEGYRRLTFMMLDEDIVAVSPSSVYRVLFEKEKYPDKKPRVISDNGPQFIARDFKEYIRISWDESCKDISILSPEQCKD